MAEQSRRKAGKAKKIIIGIAVLAVVLVLGIILAGPAVGGALAPGIIAGAAKKQILGEVSVDKVALSWTGSQRITGLRLADPDGGGDVVTVSGTLDRGLLGLISNPMDLGTLRVDALSIDVKDTKPGEMNITRAIEPAPGVQKAPKPSGPPTTARPAEPLKLPKGLRIAIEGQGLEARYTTTDAAGKPVVLGVKNLSIDASIDGADARLAITGDGLQGGQIIDIHAEALGLIAPDGTVDPSKSHITAKGLAEAPAGSPISAKVRFNLEGANGRARLVSATPAMLEAVIPASMLSPAPAPDATVSFTAAGPLAVSMEIRQLDIPLPTAAGLASMDWRKAIVEAVATTGAVQGELRDGGTVRSVGLEPSTFTLYSASENFDLGILGKLAVLLDGVSTGAVTVDAKAAGILDQDGVLRKSDMDFLRAQIQADAIPTALIQPFVQDADIDLREALGDVVRLDIRAGQLGAHAASQAAELDKMLGQEGAAKELAGRPYVAGTLESEKTTAYFDFILDQTLIQTRNKGVRVETDAAGAMARRFLPPDAGIALEGAGSAILEITGLRLPVTDGIDLRAAAGTFRAIVGNATALVGDQRTPIGLTSIDIEATLAPTQAPAWKLDARGTYENKPFAALGAGTVPGLMAPASDKVAPLGLSTANARPQGEITLVDVPTGLAKLASADAGRLADAVFGPTIRGALTSTPSGEDTIDIGIRLEGASAAVDGGARISKTLAEIGPEGITVALTRAGAVLNALSGPDQGAGLSFVNTGRVTATARNIAVPLGGQMDLKALGGNLDVSLAELVGSATKADGSPVSFSIVDANLRLALSKGGAFEATVAANGTAAGSPMQVTGGAKGLAPEGSDPMAAVRGLDSASLEARGVPTALLGIFDDSLAAIAMEAGGDTVDLIIAPASDAKQAWTMALAGRDLTVNSGVRLDGSAWAVGPTTGSMVLTPALLDAAAGDALASMDPRPRLDRPVPLELSAQRFRVAPTDAGAWGLIAGDSIVAKVRATGDIVARDVAKLGEGKNASAGIRGLEADLTMDAKGAGAATVNGLVFEPDANTNVARVSGNVRLPAEPLMGEVHITEGDVAALDRMLGTDGLLVEALGAQLGVDAQMQGAGGAVTAEVKAPRLTASASLSRGADGAMALSKPVQALWKASPAAIDRLVLGAKPGVTPEVKAISDVDVALTIDRLAIGPAGTPLKPGVFDFAGAIRTGKMALAKATGERLDFPAMSGTVKSEPSTRGMSMQLASAQGETTSVQVVGRVDNLSDAAGALTTDTALLTAKIDGQLPSALLDAIGSTDGMLGALAGPVVTLNANTKDLSRGAVGGTVDAKIKADNITADLAGQITKPLVMRMRDASEVRITRVTPEASEKLFSVLVPFLTSFQKTDQDEPATVVLNGFEAPLDGNTKNLNGEVILGLGSMRFETKTFFSKLLKFTKQKDSGRVGDRIAPVTFQITDGVARYEKMIIPTGEFTMESYGKINLNQQKMEIYVLVPFYAVAEEVAGLVSRVPGLDRLTAVPISIKGSFDNPSTSVDLEEMIKRAPNAIGSGAQEVIGGVLGGLFGGDKTKEDEKQKDGSGDGKKQDGDGKKKKKDGGDD